MKVSFVVPPGAILDGLKALVSVGGSPVGVTVTHTGVTPLTRFARPPMLPGPLVRPGSGHVPVCSATLVRSTLMVQVEGVAPLAGTVTPETEKPTTLLGAGGGGDGPRM